MTSRSRRDRDRCWTLRRGRRRGRARSARLRGAHSRLPRRSVLLGMVAAPRARLLRPSARRRAAHPDRRRRCCRHSDCRDAALGSAWAGRSRMGRVRSRRSRSRERARRATRGAARGDHHVGAAARRRGTRSRDARRAAARRDGGRALLPRARARAAPSARARRFGWWIATGARARRRVLVEVHVDLSARRASSIAVARAPSLRARLREPGPYVACVVATLVFFPVLALERRARLDLVRLSAAARARRRRRARRCRPRGSTRAISSADRRRSRRRFSSS